MPPSPASTASPPTQSSLIVMETESVSTVGSTSIQTQSTMSASIVTNSEQPINNSLTKPTPSPTKPEVVILDLTDKSNNAETSSKIDAKTTNMKMQGENGQPTTVYRITGHVHNHNVPVVANTTMLPSIIAVDSLRRRNEILVHLPSTHGPPVCLPGRVIPCHKHAHVRAPCPEKYKNKGIDTKNPIVIDSDDDGEEQMEQAREYFSELPGEAKLTFKVALLCCSFFASSVNDIQCILDSLTLNRF